MIKKKKLENSFTYYINHNIYSNKSIIITVVVRVGSAYEEKSGIAHLLEHMLMCFYTFGECPKTIKNISAHTDYFETTYTFECSNKMNELEFIIKYIADVMQGKYMKKKYFPCVKNDVINEIKDNIKYCGYQREVFSILFKGSDYFNKRAIGDMKIIKKISYEELWNFFNLWYSSNRMALIVSGNMRDKGTKMEKIIREKFSLFSPNSSKEIIQHFQIPQCNYTNRIYNVSLGMRERNITSIDIYFKVENRYPSVSQWMKNCIFELVIFQLLEMQLKQYFEEKCIRVNKISCELVELDNRYSFYLLNIELFPNISITDAFVKELRNEIQNLLQQKETQKNIMEILRELKNLKKEEIEYYLYTGIKKMELECIQNYIYNKPLLSYSEKCNLYDQLLVEIRYVDILNFYTFCFSDAKSVYIIS